MSQNTIFILFRRLIITFIGCFAPVFIFAGSMTLDLDFTNPDFPFCKKRPGTLDSQYKPGDYFYRYKREYLSNGVGNQQAWTGDGYAGARATDVEFTVDENRKHTKFWAKFSKTRNPDHVVFTEEDLIEHEICVRLNRWLSGDYFKIFLYRNTIARKLVFHLTVNSNNAVSYTHLTLPTNDRV